MNDTFRILVASDVHAGFGETKKAIENDSFDGLEETLQHATEQEVDFILLGGDLFHESIPSRYTEHKVISLLRKYCLSDKPIRMEMCSDPNEVFENSQFKCVNYEDPDINVGLPIFSIHGNHDDFSGKGLMALDILHDAGLLNLFGKFSNVDNIVVKPVLLKKGNTKVALYGIGSQRDDRLQRAFNSGKVQFCFPSDVDDWFNILVVHQNRPPRSTTRTTGAYLPLGVLPSQMNLIIWGHEHKCEIEPLFYDKGTGDPDDGFFISQPGSTVATSISADETYPKHVGVLEIRGKKSKMTPIPLQRTRQIILDELVLAKIEPHPKLPKTKTRGKDMQDERFIHKKLTDMIEKAKIERGPEQPLLPRMRLKVIYSGEWLNIPPVHSRIVGHQYDGKVANPTDIISVKTIRPEQNPDDDNSTPLRINDGADGTTVNDLLKEVLKKNHVDSGLGLLSLESMGAYVNAVTKSSESKKAKAEVLATTIDLQIKNYKDKIMEIRFEKDQVEVADIRRNIEKIVKLMKDKNRAEGAAMEEENDSLLDHNIKEELMDPDNQENIASDSFPGFVGDD